MREGEALQHPLRIERNHKTYQSEKLNHRFNINDQIIQPHTHGWAIYPAMGKKPSHVFSLKDVAILKGRELAKKKKSVLFIIDSFGTINESYNFA
jgi:hypothetical protein